MNETEKYKGAIRVMLTEIGISGDGTNAKEMYITMQLLGYTWDGLMWEKTMPNKWERAEKAEQAEKAHSLTPMIFSKLDKVCFEPDEIWMEDRQQIHGDAEEYTGKQATVLFKVNSKTFSEYALLFDNDKVVYASPRHLKLVS